MATFTKLSSGSWRVQIGRKGRCASETFLRRDDARRRAIEAGRQVDRGEAPNESRIARLTTFGELIDLHIDDMCDVGKAPLSSKAATLELLKRQLGSDEPPVRGWIYDRTGLSRHRLQGLEDAETVHASQAGCASCDLYVGRRARVNNRSRILE